MLSGGTAIETAEQLYFLRRVGMLAGPPPPPQDYTVLAGPPNPPPKITRIFLFDA